MHDNTLGFQKQFVNAQQVEKYKISVLVQQISRIDEPSDNPDSVSSENRYLPPFSSNILHNGRSHRKARQV